MRQLKGYPDSEPKVGDPVWVHTWDMCPSRYSVVRVDRTELTVEASLFDDGFYFSARLTFNRGTGHICHVSRGIRLASPDSWDLVFDDEEIEEREDDGEF